MQPEHKRGARRRLGALAVVLITGCVSSGGPQQSEADRAKLAQANTELGMQYLQRGEYETALGK
ncbi:MAG: hypothetical protein RLW62_14945, partial [Gammaproteobacteria bacterium]